MSLLSGLIVTRDMQDAFCRPCPISQLTKIHILKDQRYDLERLGYPYNRARFLPGTEEDNPKSLSISNPGGVVNNGHKTRSIARINDSIAISGS